VFINVIQVPWLGLLFSTCLLHLLVGNTHREVPSGTVIPVGRRLLLFKDDQGHSSFSHGSGSEIGSFLGWAMAIIYMCGRLPQIFLNVSHHKQLNTFPIIFFYEKYIFGTTLPGWLCHIVAIVQYFYGMC